MNILVVEDEERVADFVRNGLMSEGWTVTLATDGESGLELLERQSFDVVVLDLILPGGISGQEVCRRMRARRDLTPVLMLSALSKVTDLVAGLRLGADDYLGKPFDFDELLARIQALSRRGRVFEAREEKKAVLEVGPLCFDLRSLDVTFDGKRLDVTAKEREILRLFLGSPGKVFSRERILKAVWGAKSDPLNNIVDVYMARLRKKLAKRGGMIETIRGTGYRLRDRV